MTECSGSSIFNIILFVLVWWIAVSGDW